MREWLFAGLGISTIAAAVSVVVARSPVHSAFALILSFFGLAGLYVLWGAPFLGVVQVLIYTGAIVVLFVFVVMILNLSRGAGAQTSSWVNVLFAAAGTWLLSFVILRALNQPSLTVRGSVEVPELGLRSLSLLLFTRYLWPFEVLSLFMLAMIVAVFILARPEGKA